MEPLTGQQGFPGLDVVGLGMELAEAVLDLWKFSAWQPAHQRYEGDLAEFLVATSNWLARVRMSAWTGQKWVPPTARDDAPPASSDGLQRPVRALRRRWFPRRRTRP